MADAHPVKFKESYADMPPDHKWRFRIGGGPENYRETINWLRATCCSEGSVFNGIPSLNSGGYPYVEIEVVNLKEDSVKFIICKSDLYVFAFTSSSTKISGRSKKSDEATDSSGVDSEDNIASSSSKVSPKSQRPDEATNSSSGVDLKGKIASKNNSAPKTWFLFNLGCLIDEWEVLQSYNGAYTGGTPPTDMGLDSMSDVVCSFNDLYATKTNIERACQVFFVHLSEAARFRPVECMVYNSLARTGSWIEVFERLEVERLTGDSGINNDEEENRTLVETVSVENDIYFLIKAAGHVHPYFSYGDWEVYLRKLVHSYSDLSIIWYTYYFTNKFTNKEFEMKRHQTILSKLYMRYRKSVRFTVAVLCRLNDKKLLPVLKKQVRDGKQYEIIEAEIRKFQPSNVDAICVDSAYES